MSLKIKNSISLDFWDRISSQFLNQLWNQIGDEIDWDIRNAFLSLDSETQLVALITNKVSRRAEEYEFK